MPATSATQASPSPGTKTAAALLRAELDAGHARAQQSQASLGDDLRDKYSIPSAVLGEDYPSETFRVLKNNEVKTFWSRYLLNV